MTHPQTRTRLNSANYSDSSPASSLESTEINWAQCGSSLAPGQSLEHSPSVEEDGRCPLANSCTLLHPRDVVEGSYALYYPEKSYSSSTQTMAAQGFTYSHTDHNQQDNFHNYQNRFQTQQNNLQNYENDFQNYKNTFQKPENEVQKQNLNACINMESNDKGGSHGRTAIQKFCEIGSNTQFEMDSMVPYFEKRGYHTRNQHGYHDQTQPTHLNTEIGYHIRAQPSQLDQEHGHHDHTLHSHHGHHNQTVQSHHDHQDQTVQSHHGHHNQTVQSHHGHHNQTVQSHHDHQDQTLHSHHGHHDQTLHSHHGHHDQTLHSHVDTERGYNDRTLRSQMVYLATKLDSSLKSTEQRVFNKPSQDNQFENCQVFELPSSVQVFELPLFTPPLIQNFCNSVQCWNENRVLKIKIAAINKDSI